MLQVFRLINNEWFRQPFSPLEKTLRLPYLIRDGVFLLFRRVILPWFVVGYTLSTFIQQLWIVILLSFTLIVICELLSLSAYYKRVVLPRHLRNMQKIIRLYKDSHTATSKLTHNIELMSQLSAWSIIHFGYVGIAAWGWELIFRGIYPLITHDSPIPYQDLLIGFPNQTLKADQELWLLAKRKSQSATRTVS